MPAFHTRVAFLACAIIALGACAPSYPPVARTTGDAAFKVRIADTFPPGSSAARLRAMLSANGFQLIEDPIARRYSALDAPPNLPCFSTTRVDWTESRSGRIVLIQAARHSCS